MNKIKPQGFSYAEMVIVLIIFSVAIPPLLNLITRVSQSYYHGKEAYQAALETEHALTRLTIELEEAKKLTGILSPQTITFENNQGTAISFSLTGTNLNRDNILLTPNVSNFNIDYLDSNLQPTSLPNLVAYLHINLTTTVNGNSHSKSGLISLRNASV